MVAIVVPFNMNLLKVDRALPDPLMFEDLINRDSTVEGILLST